MSIYYKVIFIGDMLSDSFFADTFKIRGLSDLEPGRQFWAPDNHRTDVPPRYMIQAPRPLIHFCDNALDTLLWREMFGHVRYVFEILPLGDIQREICDDNLRLYQCGAPGIELKKLITEDGLNKLARDEISQNPDAAIARYSMKYIQDYIRRLSRGGR